MRPNLLIVDDDPQQLAKIRRAAREVGFQEADLVGVGSQPEAEKKLVEGTFDLAVIDLNLTPGAGTRPLPEDGLDLIRLIHKQQSECKIIALTTKLEPDAGVRAMLAGAADFVCSKWAFINWEELLVQRLRLWRGVCENAAPV